MKNTNVFFPFFKLFIAMSRFLSFLGFKHAIDKFTEINTSWVSKTTFSSTFLMRWRFQGYCCKSDSEWKVTWNYAYSPLKVLLIKRLFANTLSDVLFPGFQSRSGTQNTLLDVLFPGFQSRSGTQNTSLDVLFPGF